MDVERARELLAAERRELELALGHRGHQDDGEIAGFQEPANLAAELNSGAFARTGSLRGRVSES
jgi:hypothetical protein